MQLNNMKAQRGVRNKKLLISSVIALALTILAVGFAKVGLDALSAISPVGTSSKPSDNAAAFGLLISFCLQFMFIAYLTVSAFLTMGTYSLIYMTLLSGSVLGIISSYVNKHRVQLAAQIISGVGFMICLTDLPTLIFLFSGQHSVVEVLACLIVFIRMVAFGSIVFLPVCQKKKQADSYSLPEYERV